MKTDIDIDRRIIRLSIYINKNSERLLDAAELLRVAADSINDLHQQTSHTSAKSFAVTGVLVDVNLGHVSVYLYDRSTVI